ncbi:MAG: sulfurtransferase complex subunit TusC [Oceanospirillaceae bacterium]|nr:sulfurtransferase complex subunit TusC [Oceanospirillaceae bacterium]
MKKNILLIVRNPPFANSSNAETLDIAFACAAFDLPVSLLFLNDGILQLANNQQSNLLEKKDLTNNFRALAMYDIEDYFVIAEDAQRYQLTQNDLILNCKIINKDKMAALIRTFDTVINL